MKNPYLVLIVLGLSCSLTIASRHHHFIDIERRLTSAGCPTDYTLFIPTEACFKVVKENVTRDEAVKACLKDGAELATIKDPYENGAIRGQALELGLANIWIGLYYKDVIKKWAWLDNSPSQYTNWDDQTTFKMPRAPFYDTFAYMHFDCCTKGAWGNGPAFWLREGYACRAPFR